MTHQKTAKAIHKAVMMSTNDWESMKWEEQAKYIAVCLEPDEIDTMGLSRITPQRRYKPGSKPGIGGEEMVNGVRRNKESSWEFTPGVIPTDLEKKSLMAVCLYIGVL